MYRLSVFIRCSICALLGLIPLKNRAQMQQIDSFGSNPGELLGYVYQPADLKGPAPLVVALHGCLQDARTYAQETGWNALADRYGFRVLYPEQQTGNNPNRCFSWFLEGDINRDTGEALSIRQMIGQISEADGITEGQVYVTGLSAGGAMTVVMLAAYPEIFAAGAVIAGLPYKASTSYEGAFPAMRGEVDQGPAQWAALVKEQNPSYTKRYPRLVMFHGADDPVVNRQNMIELAEQWTHLHGVQDHKPAESPDFQGHQQVIRRSYMRETEAVVVSFELAGLGHAQAIDPGEGPRQGGQTGPYAVDKDFHTTFWAAHFFGLAEKE